MLKLYKDYHAHKSILKSFKHEIMNIVHQIILFINGTSMGCTGVQQYIVAQKSEGQCKDSEDIWRIFKMADDEGENVKKLLEVVILRFCYFF